MTRLDVRSESWPLRETFTISRGSKTHAEVIVVELSDGAIVGRGECVPYAHYGEDPASVLGQIEDLRGSVERDMDRSALSRVIGAGAARNALDCAMWDLEAKREGRPVWEIAGLDEPEPLMTAYTLSLGAPAEMAAAAGRNAHRPVLKIKLGRTGVLEAIGAIREAAPAPRLIVDANEAWSIEDLERRLPALAEAGVSLVEQPLPAGEDDDLAKIDHAVPIAADESCHVSDDVDGLARLYDVVNIKLDKAGGLTEALALRSAARASGLGVMVGCMVSTSLAMAPALLVAAGAEFVDLDGPLLLASDREYGLELVDGALQPADRKLWG